MLQHRLRRRSEAHCTQLKFCGTIGFETCAPQRNSRMRTVLGVAQDIDVLIEDIRHQALLIADQMTGSMGRSSKARVAGKATNRKSPPSRTAISSSSPLGMLALHLLAQWRKSGRKGVVFLAEN